MVEGTYIFDCEVFAHDWLFVFKEVATGEYTVIWNDNDEVLAFMERNPYLGGFNNNQKRTVQLNYAVLKNMYHSRQNHKLDEWREFCKWVETLPYSQLITG